LNNNKTVTTRFADVAGMEEVKMELSEIVDYLKNPNKYHKV
jgi:ATP-dependent Zn protease